MMTQIHCTLANDREETLIAYLYGDIDPVVRAAFDEHLGTCERCRTELKSLGGVRKHLARWAPPEPNFAPAAAGASSLAASASAGPRSWWRDIPPWAQVAAAVLVVGVSAGVANLEVRYDHNGLTVRTGWSRRSPAPATASAPAPATPDVSAPWRSDLSALEQRLRAEIQQQVSAPARLAPADLRRVRMMLDESERRQKNELALRVGETVAEINAKRLADAFQFKRTLQDTQDKLGAEYLKTRASLNYILMNASQRQD